MEKSRSKPVCAGRALRAGHTQIEDAEMLKNPTGTFECCATISVAAAMLITALNSIVAIMYIAEAISNPFRHPRWNVSSGPMALFEGSPMAVLPAVPFRCYDWPTRRWFHLWEPRLAVAVIESTTSHPLRRPLGCIIFSIPDACAADLAAKCTGKLSKGTGDS